MYSEVTSVYVPVKTPDYPFWAIILSVLVHVVLLALVIFFHHTAPPSPMQTTLVTPEQLAAVQAGRGQGLCPKTHAWVQFV